MALEIKERATVVLRQNDQILLIRRVKNGHEYFVLPGGGIEAGETPEEAAIREMKEETNLGIILDKKLFSQPNNFRGDRLVHYFLATTYTGELSLDFGEEGKENSPENQYYLEWHPVNALPAPLEPIEMLPLLLMHL